ncbi:MAG TPA: ATP-dependent protease, partial [Anaerolineae bacterium]|nr:ATP-dependent protease [Anaerolineae bacterium]
AVPYQPRAISLPAGEGAKFQAQVHQLIHDLRQSLPQAFADETYQQNVAVIKQEFEEQRNSLMQAVQQHVAELGFALVKAASGFVIVPAPDGRQLTSEEVNQLPPDVRQEMERQAQTISADVEDVLYQIHQLELTARQKMKEIDRGAAETAVQRYFKDILKKCKGNGEICLYLNEMQADILDQIQDFTSPVDSEEQIDLRRYEVNLLVDNSRTEGAPVILEANPTYHGLLGRLEYEMNQGYLYTHFTNIKCGALHWANGGYLILNAHTLFKNPEAWEGLKRALKEGKIRVQTSTRMGQGEALAKSLDPEPIPLNVKVIMLGSLDLYYNLYERDEEFRTLFKVRADFDSTMPRTPENEQEYAIFIASRCHEENLRHFEAEAVAKVIEHGSRMADHQDKLSARFGLVADLVREASFWAGENDHDLVTAADVQQALDERVYRANRAEELTYEYFLKETIFIATEGAVIGQVNGLSVMDTGDYTFGQPGRITARTFMGDDGIIHIEQETEMSGPIHDKGVLTLTGYMGGTYGQQQPLVFNASVTFEQTYGGVEGDSASSTELYALLSSLSRLPLKQGIAVTGSVNQRGEIQPIGGVNQKIEGFFHLCQERGLTGEQGVIIPAANAENLMLREEVMTAVTENRFHIWAIKHVDEGIEILTGVPAGQRREDGTYPENTVHHAVQTRLLALAEQFHQFGENEDS